MTDCQPIANRVYDVLKSVPLLGNILLLQLMNWSLKAEILGRKLMISLCINQYNPSQNVNYEL